MTIEHKPSLAQYRELQDIIALHEENNGEHKIKIKELKKMILD